MLQSAPKAEVDKMLKMSIAKDKLTDITVVSQKVDATKAVLELTAKTGDGRATSGKVTMVKEGGAWKMDEDAWATPDQEAAQPRGLTPDSPREISWPPACRRPCPARWPDLAPIRGPLYGTRLA